MRVLLFLFAFQAFSHVLFAQLPSVSSGRIVRIEQFASKYVTPRHVDIWLPDGYDDSKQYAVLYMHDGQMLFDSSQTWNHLSWDVDDVAARLIKEQKIRNLIVVGIWNGGKNRHGDYFPQKPFMSLTKAERDSLYSTRRPEGTSVFHDIQVGSDNYLRFLVKELKPYIDRNYHTDPRRASTFIAGSSMGGLISCYAICEYPKVFGGAACLSTHWPGIFSMNNNPVPEAFFRYLKKHLPRPDNHRIYFDYGTATLDSLYSPLQKTVDSIMVTKGFTEKNWMTRCFPGADHSEKAWRDRLEEPMIFLLNSEKVK